MDEDQSLDNWIFNYESGQRHKHSQFLGTLKHEFIERTRQERIDRLNKDDTLSAKRVERSTKVRKRVATTQPQGS